MIRPTLLILLFPTLTTSSSSTTTTTTLIDSTGSINRITTSPLTTPPNGIITILTNPSSSSPTLFSSSSSSSSSNDDDGLTVSESSPTLVLTTPGASLQTTTGNILTQGRSAAIAASISGSVVLTGITADDARDLTNTRHGRTLSAIFASRLLSSSSSSQETSGEKKTLLVLAVEGDDFDGEKVKGRLGELFDTCFLGLGEKVVPKGIGTLEDLYDVEVVGVNGDEDVEKILSMAKDAAPRSPLPPTTPLLPTLTQLLSTPTPLNNDPPIITTSLLTSQDSFARQSKQSRAKLTLWKNRVQRGHLVENFGKSGTTLLQRSLEQFDKDTIGSSGANASAAKYRLELRMQLRRTIEKYLTELFLAQVAIVAASTLKDFNKQLLQQQKKAEINNKSSSSSDEKNNFYDQNASAVRTAAFAFDAILSDLEIPTLGLTKTKHAMEMNTRLDAALLSFPDSPAAQLYRLSNVTQKANKNQQQQQKKKKSGERSLDVGVNLVAMIRPDGFGNLQGFCGYALGNHGITVGVHNDADAPETISQFGGVRPPFLRVQPKLNFDVEL